MYEYQPGVRAVLKILLTSGSRRVFVFRFLFIYDCKVTIYKVTGPQGPDVSDIASLLLGRSGSNHINTT